MSELAFNKHGQRIRLPENAARWGIRRLCENRTSRVVYERGVPMTVPITVNIDELRDALHRVLGDERGRFRLTALDELLGPLPNVPAAYVSLPPTNDPFGDEDVEVATPCNEVVRAAVVKPPATVAVAEPGAWSALPMPMSMNGSEYLLAEAWRGHVQMQVEMMRHMTSTLAATLAAQTSAANAATAGASQMMTAAAELLRAADGAAMPRRQPTREVPAAQVAPIVITAPTPEPRNAAVPIEDGSGMEDPEEDPLDDEAAVDTEGGDGVVDKIQKAVINVLGTAAPMLPHIATIMHGHAPGPNASASTPDGPRNSAATVDDVEDDDDDAASGFSPAVGSHLRLVHQELGADGALFRALYQNLDTDGRRALVERLCGLVLEDAVDAAIDLIAPLKARVARRSAPKRATTNMAGQAPESEVVLDRESNEKSLEREDAQDDAREHDVDVGHDVSEFRETGTTATALTPEQQAQVMEIAKHLSMAEVIRVQVLIASLSADERTAWIERLAKVSATDAAQIVRTELARRT